MIRNRLPWINMAIGGLAALFLLLAVFSYLLRPSEISVKEDFEKIYSLPKRAFEMPAEQYEAIGAPFMELKFRPATVQLPDLRRQISFYGKNDRPDADDKEPFFHFGFGKDQDIASIKTGKPLYLIYQEGKYAFSPENGETTLWVAAAPRGDDEVDLSVRMIGEEGQLIDRPTDHAEIDLKKKRIPRWGDKAKWELGGNRVDASLLARQKARWYGKDRFLEKHGGVEFKDQAERERIDFGEGNDRYSLYVKEGDSIVWKNGQWQQVLPGMKTRAFPLLVVKNIDNRLMNFELWDAEGKGQVKIRLLKSSESWAPKRLFGDFKFIGARTRSQFVFEIGEERLQLSPQDWLLRADEGWKKLTTTEEIDDYVDRKEVGVLFVLDGVRRIGGRQMLTGTLFNSTRTTLQPVELPMQQGGGKFVAIEEPEEEEDEEEEKEDDDEEEQETMDRRRYDYNEGDFSGVRGGRDIEELRKQYMKGGRGGYGRPDGP